MPQRYPDPDRGHCWDSILLFLSELVDVQNSAKEIADLRADGTTAKVERERAERARP
jgi:hypothetical protein